MFGPKKEAYELKDYIYDLKQMKSEVAHTIKEGDDKELVMAAKHYPGKLNHLLLKRDLKSTTLIFPFIDLPIFDKRKQNIELLDLNVIKDDSEILWDVFRRIDRELEEL